MNQEKSEHQPKEQFRVVINREANDTLEAFLAKLAAADESMKITRSDVANYIFGHLEDIIGEAEITEIRALHFDAKKALEVILKGASSSDELPDELRQALLRHYGIKPQSKEKRTKSPPGPKLDKLTA